MAVTGAPAHTRTKRGAHFVPRSLWAARKAANPSSVEVGSGSQLHRRHHLVAHDEVGHGVDDSEHDVGVALEDAGHRGGREVLAVDAQPVVGRPAK